MSETAAGNHDPTGNSPGAPHHDEYVVVARRYRPQTFDELIGQGHVAQALKQAIATGRVGHAYLFTGARGVGKTSAARILAKALNCTGNPDGGPTPTPCNQCEVCRSVSTGDDVDVLEIDGASNRGIDEIRQLRQNVAIRPSRARFKVYIIDEVHMLTKEAFNALLKTLEEPPEHVKFVFATTEPNKIPITILSRCQRFDFAGIESTAIQTRLAQIAESEGVGIDVEALQILAMRAAGSMRDSQSLLEQLLAVSEGAITGEDVNRLLGIAPAQRVSDLARRLAERDAAGALAEVHSAIAGGADVGQLLDQLLGYFRDVMAVSVGAGMDAALYALPSQAEEVTSLAGALGPQTLLAILQVLDETAARLRVSVHSRTLAEMAVVRVCHLEDLDDLADLVASLREGGTPPAGPPAKRPVGPSKGPNNGPDNGPAPQPKPPTPAGTTPASGAPTGGSAPAPSGTAPSGTAPSGTAPQKNQQPSAANATASAAPATSQLNGSGAAPPPAAAPRPISPAPTAERPPEPARPRPAPPRPRDIDAATAANAALQEAEQESDSANADSGNADSSSTVPSASAAAGDTIADDKLQQAWQAVSKQVGGILGNLAAMAVSVGAVDERRVCVRFDNPVSRDTCDQPAHKQQLEDALESLAGRRLHLEFEAKAPAVTAPQQRMTRRQRQAEIAQRPFVQAALELFDGQPDKLRYVPPANKN
ncbi:DNA polymerase III subunit tau [Posidoniimonas polymericola]|uniref:DNA polymerase III subunit gamma/tau n=1 Tax=Posidoniimonas polymericola TaxID=2528002 RepID=A0A5C5YUK6_9BACT|nr:DNA polymerase III subunit gamma/tau [Posidoniimonas polymericola]TWT78511.1 DNA polymerase III subunit tau [Posidoniimonas polymericola]